MQIQTRIAELKAQQPAAQTLTLALKDLGWWIRAIENASKEGRRYCKDSERVWYMNSFRTNPEYCTALKGLLGEGFTVELADAQGNDGLDDYWYVCVRVSW